MTSGREAILALLAARRAGATICPSEAARALAGDDPSDWRPLMPAMREAAAALADEGRVAVTRRGRVVDARSARGPVRVRLVRGPVHPITKP
jgi:hypothetical protein